MRYQFKTPPPDPASLPAYLSRELQLISQAFSLAQDGMTLDMQYRAPVKPRDGLVVLADGTKWNPGSGAGFYGYRAGTWRFLG